MSFLLLEVTSTLSKLWKINLKTWIQYCNELLYRKMEALGKLHLSITVHMYPLVAINYFNPECLKLEEKEMIYQNHNYVCVNSCN